MTLVLYSQGQPVQTSVIVYVATHEVVGLAAMAVVV